MRTFAVTAMLSVLVGAFGCGKEAPAGVDKVTQLEKRLAQAESDNAALGARLAALEKLAAAQSREKLSGPDEIAALRRDIESLSRMLGEEKAGTAELASAVAELRTACERLEKAPGAIGDVAEAAGGPLRADRIEARGLTLLDDSGARRATLGMGEDGATLALYSATGQRQAELAAYSGGSRLVLSGDDDGTFVTVVSGASPAVAISQGGSMGTVLAPRSLTVLDERGRTRAAVEVTRDKPSVSITDENGQVRAVLGHGTPVTRTVGTQLFKTESSFVMFDSGGQVTWFAP